MDLSWTFHRHGQLLTLQRREIDEGFALVLSGLGAPRTYHFGDVTDLERFQGDMERFLVKTGWLLDEFSPDRRTGTDRRTFPRIDVDRRRWWTDGLRRFQAATSSRRRQKPSRVE